MHSISFFASDANIDLFKKGNDQYEQKNYRGAIDSYQNVMQNKFESSQLYFNLGNAYFKINDYTQAIYFYEKAKRLNPSDEDISFNLALANTKIIDKIEVLPEIFIVRWWNAFCNMFSSNQWSVILIGFIALFLIFMGFYLFSNTYGVKRTSFYIGLSLFIVLGIVYFANNYQYSRRMNEREAIVFNPTVNIKASPDENSNTIFVIHEGSKIQITDKIGSWFEIKIQNGSKGWIKLEDVKTI